MYESLHDKMGIEECFSSFIREFLTTNIAGKAQLTCHCLLRAQAYNYRNQPTRIRINPGEKIGLGLLKIRV